MLQRTMQMKFIGMQVFVEDDNLMHAILVDGPGVGMVEHTPLLLFDAHAFVSERPSTTHYTVQDPLGRSWGVWPLKGKVVKFLPGGQQRPPSHQTGDLSTLAEIERAAKGHGKPIPTPSKNGSDGFVGWP